MPWVALWLVKFPNKMSWSCRRAADWIAIGHCSQQISLCWVQIHFSHFQGPWAWIPLPTSVLFCFVLGFSWLTICNSYLLDYIYQKFSSNSNYISWEFPLNLEIKCLVNWLLLLLLKETNRKYSRHESNSVYTFNHDYRFWYSHYFLDLSEMKLLLLKSKNYF